MSSTRSFSIGICDLVSHASHANIDAAVGSVRDTISSMPTATNKSANECCCISADESGDKKVGGRDTALGRDGVAFDQ